MYGHPLASRSCLCPPYLLHVKRLSKPVESLQRLVQSCHLMQPCHWQVCPCNIQNPH